MTFSCTGIVKNAGPGITETVNKTLDEEEAMYRNIRQKEIDQLKHSVAMETTAQVPKRKLGKNGKVPLEGCDSF